VKRVLGRADPEMRDTARAIRSRPVREYAIKITLATHRNRPRHRDDEEVRALGSSPRGSQALILGAKVRDGRPRHVSCEDVRAVRCRRCGTASC
jgi:hypothetical protein